MEQMTVQIVTPDGIRYDHHAAFILVKTTEGELGIYPGQFAAMEKAMGEMQKQQQWLMGQLGTLKR